MNGTIYWIAVCRRRHDPGAADGALKEFIFKRLTDKSPARTHSKELKMPFCLKSSGDFLKRRPMSINPSVLSVRRQFAALFGQTPKIIEGGVFGCRMTGGGFGGYAVALIKESSTAAISRRILDNYEHAARIVPTLFASRPGEGATVLSP